MIKKLLVIIMTIAIVISNFTWVPSYAEDEVVKIDRLSISVRDGGKDVNGKYTWVTDGKETSKDHRFTFRINYAISGTYDYEPEKIQIRIPKQILRNRSGNFADYYDMSIPEWDDPDLEDTTDFVYKEIKEKVNPEDPNSEEIEYILIYNRIPVPAGANGFIEVSYLTSERTWEYLDMGKSDDFYAYMHIEQGQHADPEDETSTDTYIEANKESNKIPVYIDTTAKITNIDKQVPQKLYRSWQSNWGDTVKPDNSDDYFYLVWPIRTWITANQPYNFDIEDIFTAEDGFVVGYSLTNGNFKESYPPQYLKENYSSYSRYDYVLTAHPKAKCTDNEWQVKNSVRGHVDPYDQVDEDTYANDNAIFKYKAPEWQEPTGHFMLYKKGYKYTGEASSWNGCNSEEIRRYNLDAFKEGEINQVTGLKYRVRKVGYAYPWTRNSDINDPSAFGHNPVKYIVTDNELSLGKPGGQDEIQLAWQDANIYKLDFTFELYDANFDEEELKFSTGSKVSEFKDSEWMDIFIETKNSGDYTKIARWNPQNGEYVFINDTYIQSAVGQTIEFKTNDVTGFKIEHSNARYYTEINLYPYVTLHNTNKVMEYIGDDMKIYVHDKADSKVYDYQDNEIVQFNDKHGYDYIMGIHMDGHISKKVNNTKNNKVKKNYVITWQSSAYESYHDEEAVFRATEQSSGTFYDLLPLGGEYVNESIKVYGYKDGTLNERNNAYQGGTKFEIEDFDISIKENYKKSGRDLLTVKINEPAEYYTIQYDSVHTWNNIKDYGKDVVNDVAYETGNEKIGDGQVDGSNNTFGNLDPDAGNAKKFLYEDAQHHISLITNALLNLKKQIRASGDENYSYKTRTYPDSDYYYNIRFATDDETTATDLIVMDSLENYTTASGQTSAWRGKLKGINVKEIELLGADPKIYYSSVPNLDLEKYKNRTNYPDTNSVLADKIDDENVWVDEETFGNPANATAFLVDIRTKQGGGKFILDYDTGISMTVAMRSPKEVGALDHYNAYNNIYLWDTVHSKDGDVLEDSLVHQDFTQITYVVTADIPIHKVSAKDNSITIKGTKWELKGDSVYGNTMDQEGTTDANGNYTFKKIEAGTYTLRETYVNNDYFINPTTYTVIIGMDGSVQIGDGTEEVEGNTVVTNSLDTDNNRFVLTNEVRVHGDLEFTKVGLIPKNTEYADRIGNARYAVSVYGIETDVNEKGELLGLTFGPAVGEDYTNSFKDHNPSGNTSKGNLHRCIHHDTWREIVEWNYTDPYVYEQCINELCTKAIDWNTKDISIGSQNYRFIGTGDGASTITAPTSSGSVMASQYELRLYYDVWGGTFYSTSTLRRSLESILEGFPEILQNSISKRHTVFYDLENTEYSFVDDKLWALSIVEINPNWQERWKNDTKTNREGEGHLYSRFTDENSGRIAYNCLGEPTPYWTRSTGFRSDKKIDILSNGGYGGNTYDNVHGRGLSPCFSLDKKARGFRQEVEYQNLPNTTFKLTGTSDYGTEYNEYVTSTSRGKVSFKDIEKGTYELIETKPNDDYINPNIKYTVTVDENGNVSIDGADFIEKENGETYLQNEAWHNFSLRKTDAVNGGYLEGAEFKLIGTDAYGKEVDMHETSNSNGRVTFDPLASGTYILQETKAPKNYEANPKKYVVEIDRLGNVKIDGLTQDEQGFFVFPDPRGQDGKIKIIKKWNDGKTGEDAENRELPEITISTKEPEAKRGISVTKRWEGDVPEDRPDNIIVRLVKRVKKTINPLWGEAYAVFDSADGSLIFFRDEPGKYTNEQTDGTKTYYTNIETLQATQHQQIPWDSNHKNVQSVIFQDTIKPVSTAYWFYSYNKDYANFTSVTGLEKLDTSNVIDMSCMFYNCDDLTTLDVSHFDTSNVIDMSRMFSSCQNLATLDVSCFDTSKVTSMNQMFYDCSKIIITLNVMNMPLYYSNMCIAAATASGSQIILKYIDPVTSEDIDRLVATNYSTGNVVNGGQGTFVSPDTSGVWNTSNPSPSKAESYETTENKIVEDSRKWIDNKNGTWIYDFNHTQEDGDEYYVYEEPVDGYISDAIVDGMKEVVNGVAEIVNEKLDVGNAKYAVQIYGIEQDKGKNGETLGITFGPAIGGNYVQSYKSHTPTGTTASDNAHRCIHNDSWRTIISWNDTDPYVYEQCIAEGCTHSIVLDMSKTAMDNNYTFTGSGDGPGILMSILPANARIWNAWGSNYGGVGSDYHYNNVGGWGASNIRAVLNGVDEFTTNDTYAQANNITSDTALISAFPEILQDAIGERTTKYDSVYNQKIEYNLKTTYDKLFLLSPNEMNLSSSAPTYYQHPLEADFIYDKFRNETLSTSSNINFISYNEESDTPFWWLRSFYENNEYNLCSLRYDHIANTYASNTPGVSPCFSLRGRTQNNNQNNTNSTANTNQANTSNLLNNTRGGDTEENYTPKPADWGEAYAVFDSSDGSLTFFRDEEGKYTNGQTDGTKTYYTGVELTGTDSNTVSWRSENANVTNVMFKDAIKPTNTSMWFNWMADLLSIEGIEKLDTSNVTDMSSMFSNCRRLTTLDVSHFNTSNVTDMSNMFSDCRELTTLDVSHLNTSNVTDMNRMFDNCYKLATLDVSYFNTSNVTNMSSMFDYCQNLAILDVSHFDTSKVTNMSSMFSFCKRLVSLDVSHFNTSNVTDMQQMFYECQRLTSLDVSHFDTSNVTDMGAMFGYCQRLTNLDLSHFDTSNVTSMFFMFFGCRNLRTLDISHFNTSNVTDMSYMFQNCKSLTSLDLSNFDTSKVTDMVDIFISCGNLTTIALGSESIFNENIPKENWQQYATLSRRSIHEGGNEFVNLSDYDGSAPGWYKVKGTTAPNEADMMDIYKTSDDISKWVKVDDETWEYTFDVFDDEAQYYAWESEIPYGYTTDTDRNNYQIINDGKGNYKQAIIMNHTYEKSEEFGNLKIEKEIKDFTAEDSDVKFAFDIELKPAENGDSKAIEGIKTFGDTVFKDGKATVYLKHGESIIIPNLPVSYEYIVTEKPNGDYPLDSSNGDRSELVGGETATAKFVNKKVEVEEGAGGFKLKKQVKGGFALFTDKFNFAISFTDLTPNKTYTYGENAFTTNANGEAEVSVELGHNEEIEFTGLPINARYTVTELANSYRPSFTTEESRGNWTLVEKGQGSANAENNLSTANERVDENENITITFTNTKESVVPTGRKLAYLPLILLAALIAMLIWRRYKGSLKE